MKNIPVHQLIVWIAALVLTPLAHAQDLPFTSLSTGADGPLAFRAPGGVRYQHAMAYDAARARILSFGGSGYMRITQSYDGTNWTTLSPLNAPTGRQEQAMAYDAARQQVVLFGGQTSTNNAGDTWLWDGTDWTQATPANSPSARYNHAMAYDAARQRIVLFGGSATTNGSLSDTWLWNGTNWVEAAPATIPSGRGGHGMAYHAGIQQTVLHGGNGTETWLWNGTNWTAQPVNPIGLNLSDFAMVYDATRQEVVAFGGYSPGIGYRNDTWVFNGTNWFQRNPINPPSLRTQCGAAPFPPLQQVVVYGGYDPGFGAVDSTYSWNGTSWNFEVSSAQTFDMRGRPSGVWNYTTIDVPAGIRVSFIPNTNNTPVTWFATSNVTINGILDLNGQAGVGQNPFPGAEALPGPGGFRGGLGGVRFDASGSFAGTPGQGPGGGFPGISNNQAGFSASSSYMNAYLQPLIGGSGGGGSGSGPNFHGPNGGAGGGAIYISSSRDITLNGTIFANGGSGGSYQSTAGYGSGGAIRLQADRVSGTGRVETYSGAGVGAYGVTRIEGFYRLFLSSGTFNGPVPFAAAPTTNQSFNFTGALVIANVAGQNVQQPPGGNITIPDVIFTAPGPITVTATSSNIPNGTPIVLRVTANGQIIQSTNNLAGGAATFNLTVPAGVGTVQATASFTLP